MENTRLSKKGYLMLLHLDERGSTTWASNIKNILLSYGFGHVWYDQGVGNEKQFMVIFKQRVQDVTQQNWYADITSLDKLRTYCKFKSQLSPEKYLFVITNASHRRFLSKLRCSSHVLNIETGRRLHLEPVDRVCKVCGDGNVEDVQ